MCPLHAAALDKNRKAETYSHTLTCYRGSSGSAPVEYLSICGGSVFIVLGTVVTVVQVV